jgi:hypothetical protein
LPVAGALILETKCSQNERMCHGSLKQFSSAYLRAQAKRCQQLSRNCMDLGTARDLRLMAEEYSVEASRIESPSPARQGEPC